MEWPIITRRGPSRMMGHDTFNFAMVSRRRGSKRSGPVVDGQCACALCAGREAVAGKPCCPESRRTIGKVFRKPSIATRALHESRLLGAFRRHIRSDPRVRAKVCSLYNKSSVMSGGALTDLLGRQWRSHLERFYQAFGHSPKQARATPLQGVHQGQRHPHRCTRHYHRGIRSRRPGV